MIRAIKNIIPLSTYIRFVCLSRKSLSQFGQDAWVFGEVFNGKERGFFVEIGSADGININNTFLLEHKFHWDGVCIEANPEYFEMLKKYRKVNCINACVDVQESTVNFFRDGLTSGIVSDDTDNQIEITNNNLQIIQLPTKTLENVLKSIAAPKLIDYLSIDVEGAEERILSSFPFDKFIFNCITIERPSNKIKKLLAKNDYILIKEIPYADSFYIHESFMNNYGSNLINFWKANRKWLF